ncbi:hypothetical protein HK102_003235 [Quaeritorhiza haematococci]|nr:hypothetical protein HK102_003235 [Quaeritorhiza haematococci]
MTKSATFLAALLSIFGSLASVAVVNAQDAAAPAAPSPSSTPETLIPLYSFSLHPPYVEENLNNRWWNFGGDTIMEVNQFIRLTQDRQSKRGFLWGKVPFTSSSWLLELEFKVHGHGSTLFGDGFAFWYTTDKEVEGPVFGSKDEFTGLGVFFDTYSNGKHRHTFPYVNAMVGDGKTKYDHSQDGKPTEIGGCPADFRNKNYPTKARIKYIRNQVLQVQLNIRGNDEWSNCFTASNVTLPTMGYLGFTAFTGDVTDNHDIIKIVVNGIVNPDINKYMNMAGKPSQESSSSSGSSMFTWLLVFFIIGVVAGGLWYFTQNMKNKNSKRF